MNRTALFGHSRGGLEVIGATQAEDCLGLSSVAQYFGRREDRKLGNEVELSRDVYRCRRTILEQSLSGIPSDAIVVE